MLEVQSNILAQLPRGAKYLGKEFIQSFSREWGNNHIHVALIYPDEYEILINDPFIERLIHFLAEQYKIQVDIFFLPDFETRQFLLAQKIILKSLWFKKSLAQFDVILIHYPDLFYSQNLVELLQSANYTDELKKKSVLLGESNLPLLKSITNYSTSSWDEVVVLIYAIYQKEDLSGVHLKQNNWIEKNNLHILNYHSWKKRIKPIIPLVNPYHYFHEVNNKFKLIWDLNPFLYSDFQFNLPDPFLFIDWNLSIRYSPYWIWLKDETFSDPDSLITIHANPFSCLLLEKKKDQFIKFIQDYPFILSLDESIFNNTESAELQKSLQQLEKLNFTDVILYFRGEADAFKEFVKFQSTILEKKYKNFVKSIRFIPDRFAVEEIFELKKSISKQEYSAPDFSSIYNHLIALNFRHWNEEQSKKACTDSQLEEMISHFSQRIKSSSSFKRHNASSEAEDLPLGFNGLPIKYGRYSRRVQKKSTPVRKVIRVRYEKVDEARFLTHRDIIRIMDKFSRRGKAPLVYTQGKRPRPRIAFGPPLAVGYESIAEYADFTVETYKEASLKELLNPIFPEGLRILEEEVIYGKIPSLAASILENEYLIQGVKDITLKQVNQLLESNQILVDRQKNDQVFAFDIRPYIKEIRINRESITLILRSVENKMARVSEVLQALNPDLDLYDSSIQVKRIEQYVLLPTNKRVDPITYIRELQRMN